MAWRRDFHKNPELGNRETRTSKIIADELRKLGFEVTTGVATTGVVGVLRGGRPGPVVALRSDMDALPVTEQVDLPFKSTAKAQWNGQEVGVMHACGHDNHMAILLGTATALARMKDRLPGTVKVIFQPAEEGPPPGETGGAEQMVKENVLENPKVDAVFGLHVFPFRAGEIVYRPGPLMASTDSFMIKVKGRQTHGAIPWGGIDPIVVGSQIVMGLQTIISRQVNITEAPAVVTIGRFTGGNRANIIPDEIELEGTIRAFDENVRKDIQRRVARDRDEHRGERRRDGDGDVHAGLSRDAQRRSLTAADAADAAARRGRGQRAARSADRHRGRFLVLPAEGAGAVLLPRRDAAGSGSGEGGDEPLAAVLRRRIGVADRREGDDEPRPRLPVR